MPKSQAGTSNAERKARGLVRWSGGWFDFATIKKLDEMCADSGYSRIEQVEAMIDAEYDNWKTVQLASGQRVTDGRRTGVVVTEPSEGVAMVMFDAEPGAASQNCEAVPIETLLRVVA